MASDDLSPYEQQIAAAFHSVKESMVVPVNGRFVAIVSVWVDRKGGRTQDMIRNCSTADAAETWMARRVAVVNAVVGS